MEVRMDTYKYTASPPDHRITKKLLNSVRLFPLFSPLPLQERVFLCYSSYSQNFEMFVNSNTNELQQLQFN